MSQNDSYKVYIACYDRDRYGTPTKDYILAKQLYKKLTQRGIHTYLIWKCNPDDRSEALDFSSILVVAGVSSETLSADNVRNDYEDFIASVELAGKRRWRVFNYLSDMQQGDLPNFMRTHRSYDASDTDRLVEKIESTLSAEAPRNCISDADPNRREEAIGELPELLPESSEDIHKENDDDNVFSSSSVHGHIKARKVPQLQSEEAPDNEMIPEKNENQNSMQPPVTPAQPMPSVPVSGKEDKPVRIKPAKINKVDFSVVTPEELNVGKSSVIDLLMYTRSQRSIVKRTIAGAQEKSSEAARSSGSVSVKQGSRVTALLFSDDIEIPDGSRTMVWSGDALDFKFRVGLPEDYAKKEVDFGCCVQFDGIEITRLYFSVPVGKKKAVVKFTRKDCRKAFVSYSHNDRLRVAEQLLAIQEVAPKLRFWMDTRSMTAGDMWRNAIASAIKNADVFLLFWSVSAKDSPEVRKEWEYALKMEQGGRRMKNGARFISPVPLDSPSECPPPAELGDLHFGDPSFDSDIENIEKIKVWAVRGKNIKFL